jgi:hypothetical protein
VKEEAHVCGSDGFLYPSKSAIECGNTQGGKKSDLLIIKEDMEIFAELILTPKLLF